MSVAALEAPEVLHAVPGRIRVHLPEWSGEGQSDLEERLQQLRGVGSARANTLTANVVVRFDPALTDIRAILSAIPGLTREANSSDAAPRAAHSAIHERHGEVRRARIAVPGLDRNPALVQRMAEHFQSAPGVTRVSASALTGRVMVEFSHHETTLEELMNHLAHVELPDPAGEDHPAHPLERGLLLQSAARTTGAGIGLSLLAARQLLGLQPSTSLQSRAMGVAAVTGVLQSFPAVRTGLRRIFGRDVGDLVLSLPTIVALTVAGSPLGLAVAGIESFRLLTEMIARRSAWRRYESRLENVASAHPGDTIRLETGERTPLGCSVIEGFGTAAGRRGLPERVAPGACLPAGARLYGGPFVLQLTAGSPFTPEARPAPETPTLYTRYLRYLGPASLGYAAITAIFTRSLTRTFQAFLLVNSRTAIIGKESADTGASARVLRAGVTVVGTRPERVVRRPDVLLIDGPRVLTDGFEIADTLSLDGSSEVGDILALAGSIGAAAGSPWGGALSTASIGTSAEDGDFDGTKAGAVIDGMRYTLGAPSRKTEIPAAIRLRYAADQLLLLRREGQQAPLGALVIRPRLSPGVSELVETCRRRGVELALLPAGDSPVSLELSRRTEIPVLADADGMEAIRERQSQGLLIAFASDSADAARAFAECDLAIGVTSGRTSRFPARADLLAPDLLALAAIVEAGARRDGAVRDAVALSVVSNLFGAAWGFRGGVGVARASYVVYVTALSALTDGWIRLRGGDRPWSSIARLVDPRPERWGRRSVADVLHALNAHQDGLTSAEAAKRYQAPPRRIERNAMVSAMLAQIRSPLTGILAAGAGLSLVLGATADVVMIGATIVANSLVGAWQERQTGHAIAALEQIGTSTARVLRDGVPAIIPSAEVVPGDVLLLAPGDRVAADGRMLSAQNFEVDEAALTGESLPVSKDATGGNDASRIVLAGSDVTVGRGTAVVVAVGQRTRMGATAAALALGETSTSPLGIRLNRMLKQVLPLVAGGGLIVFVSGLLRHRPLLPQLAIGASIAIAAVPEGLPLLAGVGEAAVARRLSGRNALVRRLSAVEALGRVDVACTDKTGTLTEGHLALTIVASMDHEQTVDGPLPDDLCRVVVVGGLASPHPDATDAKAHPTDVAIIKGAEAIDLGDEIRAKRTAELPFDPARSFHAALVHDTLCLKGAVEELTPRCRQVRRDGRDLPLDDAGRDQLLARAQALAERGLRVLMVAEGPPNTSLDDPSGLTALGFLGISDPLRPEVVDAVRRCHDAGVRVVMLTGDHPATARAIARQAGLLEAEDGILTGAEVAELLDSELDARLERATVIARVTPLDKLRIVESLQRRGHTVAMTGDGVNDAPALRLADVGVAMGIGGTEVARQAADVVLADDNFSTLVEALVEGRSFWRNIRRALGLLLGGNLGELGLVVGASVLGLASPLLTRQILAVNLVTDVLPSLAVALQPPETRHLASLSREGTAALDKPLRNDIWLRGFATAAPSLVAYLIGLRISGLEQARSVAFASVVGTQLAQTLDAGRSEDSLTRSVFGAVLGSVGVLLAALTVPPLRGFLGLVTPIPSSWLLIGITALVAPILGRGLRYPALHVPSLRLRSAPVLAIK